MSSSQAANSDPNLKTIRESFGRVVYTHKTHEKARELETAKANAVKWVNIFSITLTSSTLVGTAITNQRALLYVGSILSALTLAFIIFQLSFNPEKEAERHRGAAKGLWYVREKYVSLLTDLNAEPNRADITRRRDALTEELKLIHQFAPDTSRRAYRAARSALKINEEMTFSDEELDRFLPESLHISRERDVVE